MNLESGQSTLIILQQILPPGKQASIFRSNNEIREPEATLLHHTDAGLQMFGHACYPVTGPDNGLVWCAYCGATREWAGRLGLKVRRVGT